MSEAITVINRDREHSLMVPAQVGTMKMGTVLGPAYAKVHDQLTAHQTDIDDSNRPYTLYRNIDWDQMNKKGFFAQLNMMFFKKWDLEIGITCPPEVPQTEGVEKLWLEAGRYVRAIHIGPYRKVGDTYTRIRHYAAEQGLGSFKPFSIEFYLNDPGEVPEADLQTEVLVPLSD